MSDYHFYPLSERLGLLRINNQVIAASFLTPEEARCIALMRRKKDAR